MATNSSISTVSFNLGLKPPSDHDIKEIANAVAQNNPEIIIVNSQEGLRNQKDQFDFCLNEKLQSYSIVSRCTFSTFTGKPGEIAQAILVKKDCEQNYEVKSLPSYIDRNGLNWNKGAVSHAISRKGNNEKTIKVSGVHLDSYKDNRRCKQLYKIWQGSKDEPYYDEHIIAGDFNTRNIYDRNNDSDNVEPTHYLDILGLSEAIKEEDKSKLTYADKNKIPNQTTSDISDQTDPKRKVGGTNTHYKRSGRLDRVFHQKTTSIESTQSGIIETDCSDHNIVYALYKINWQTCEKHQQQALISKYSYFLSEALQNAISETTDNKVLKEIESYYSKVLDLAMLGQQLRLSGLREKSEAIGYKEKGLVQQLCQEGEENFKKNNVNKEELLKKVEEHIQDTLKETPSLKYHDNFLSWIKNFINELSGKRIFKTELEKKVQSLYTLFGNKQFEEQATNTHRLYCRGPATA